MHTSPFASAPHLPAPGGIARPLATTLLALAAMLGAGAAQAALSAVPSAAAPPGKEQVQQALSGLAVPFEKNQGQFDARVAFMAKTFAGAVFVTHDGEIVYSLPGKPLPSPADSRPSTPASAAAGLQTPPVQRGPGWRLTESLPGAQRLTPQGGQPAATQVSRFTPQGRFSAPTYQSVMIGQAWPGIALELAARGNNVEKLFHVAPGADARQIQVQLHGATGVRLADDGALVVGTGNGEVAYTAPVAWQDIGGQRVPVAVRYALQGAATAAAATGQPPVQGYGFALAAYDQRHPLVIDPLIQSTYLGGSGNDAINSLALASNGDVVVAGYTYSTNLPCTTTPGCANGAQPGSGGSNDGFVARLSGDLKTLRQSSYLGGSGGDIITSLALASDGDVIVAGHTSSTNLPCTSIAFAGCADGAQPGYSGGTWDGFVARLSGDLQTLRQSSYLGGSGDDIIKSLALASDGDVVVAGYTYSTNLPCTTTPGCANGAQPGSGGSNDGFVARLSGDLKTLRQSSYLGGSGGDIITSLALASDGDVIVAGHTSSTNLPCTSIAFAGCADGAQPGYSGGTWDGFVARLSGDLQTLRQSSYLGGSGDDIIKSLALASDGDVVVAGETASTNLPCTSIASAGCANGAQPISGGGNDGFVARLSGDLQTLRQSSYLGGSDGDIITSLALVSNGDVVVAGYTRSTNLPCTSTTSAGCDNGAQPGHSGGTWDGFVARLSGDLQTLLQSSYLGGSSFDAIASLALASNGDVVVAGETRSTNLPCTSTTSAGCANGAQPGYGGGGYDSFVARLSGDLKGAQPQTISFAAQSPASRPFVLNSQFALSPTATASSGLAVAYGSSTPTVCTVDSASGMVTMLAIGTCTVVANQAGNAHWLAAAVGQSIGIGAQTQWSGPGPGGSGTVQLAISGGSPTCTLQAGATGFNLNTPSTVQAAANLPTARPGASMPLGLFAFSATGCAGNTLTISITYPGANLSGLTPHKYGPATPGAAPSWFAHGAVSGNTVTYTVTDNGQGDNNAAPGVIEDPFAMLLLAAPPAGPHAIPTLGEWSLMLLSLLAAALGAGALRRRGPQAPGV